MTAWPRAFSKMAAEDELDVLLRDFPAEGYAGLQLKEAQYGPYLEEPARALEELGRAPGTYSALITGARLDEAGRARIDRTIRFAASVGAERIVFCHHHTHDGVDAAMRRRFAAEICDLATSARERGVAFSLHHHTDQPVMTLSDFREFFDVVEPGELGLTIDTAHLAKSGVTDIPALIEEFAPYIDNLHLKDYDGQWRLFGEGELDLDGILAALERSSYDGWLCVDEESEATVTEGMRASAAWLDSRGR